MGLPVTEVEYRNLVLRGTQREALQPAVDFVDAHDAEFGGLFFDQSRGRLDMVVMVLPETTPAALDKLRTLVPADANVETSKASTALRELRNQAAQAAVVSASAKATIVVDTRGNRVLVRVPLSDAGSMATSLAGLDAVDVSIGTGLESAACSSRTVCYLPWRGGTYVASPNEACTWGFNARKTTTASDATRYVITAGHCALLGQDLKHNGSVVNTSAGVNRTTFDLSGSNMASDSLRATLKTDSGSRNLVYINSSSMAYAITSVSHYTSQHVGDAVCMSTVVSGYRCGTITFEDFQSPVIREIDGKVKTVTHLWETSFVTVKGDSGGPVISQTLPRAFGIVTAFDSDFSNHMVYSSIDFVLNDLAVRLCLNSACT